MFAIDNIRDNIVGLKKEVSLLNGKKRQYVFFDNAASTPSFQYVLDKVNESVEWYSAVHRGAGIKSIVSTDAYIQAGEIIKNFVNAGDDYQCVFVKNATEALNKLAARFSHDDNSIILTTEMEHHSNDLPWRKAGRFEFIKIKEDGSLDYDDAVAKIEKYSGKLKLVTLTGASNVAGFLNPYHDIAEHVHKHGALICLDAAQLAPHRKIDMTGGGIPLRKIDFLTLSAHKMYAPFGSGALIAPTEFLKKGDPDHVGGGTVKVVTYDEVHWNEPPYKDEAGSPNVPGAIAFAAACKVLDEIGMDNAAQHEIELTEYMWRKLEQIPEIQLTVPADYENIVNRLGVITFNVKDMSDGLVASILCYEFGIGVRTGCFCAHPYLKKLLKVTDEQSRVMIQNILNDKWVDIPGAIRASFGIYNTKKEIDYFIECIKMIINGDFIGKYDFDESTNEYLPQGYQVLTNNYFSI